MIGPHPRVVHPPYSFCLLDRPQGDESSMFFEASNGRVGILAFQGPAPIADVAIPAFPQPESSFPNSLYYEDYFFTWADLENVVQVTPCKGVVGPGICIIGFLLVYSTGHQESVGQVRLDGLEPAIDVDRTKVMWLRFSSDAPRVTSFGFSGSASSRTDVLNVAWHGRLEWWFSHKQCKVWHNGQASPRNII